MHTALPAAPPRAGKILSEAVAYAERRIAAVPVRTRPFPHIVVDDLLPGEVRGMLNRYWPDTDRFGRSNYMHRRERLVSRLTATAEGPEQAFWSAMRTLTTRIGQAIHDRLEPYLVEKFRPILGADWKRDLGEPCYCKGDAMLAHYTGTVDLAPHVDNVRIAINGFVYLDDPEQPTQEPRRGTMLYRAPGFAWPSNQTIPTDIRKAFLREAEEVEWRDNRLLAYVNGPTSFHGVPRHDLGAGRRRLLMFGSVLDEPTVVRLKREANR